MRPSWKSAELLASAQALRSLARRTLRAMAFGPLKTKEIASKAASPHLAASKPNCPKPMCRQPLRPKGAANDSSLYLALLGRWFPGPNFQANRLSVLAAICDKMQFGSLRWILQLRLPEHVGWWPIHCERAAATLAVDLRSPHCLRAKRAFAIAIVTRRAETPAGWLGEERSDE
jgi:hypothetical protein